MKHYDYAKAVKLIEENKENLESVCLGMHEDWFWTAETIWENGEYKKELFSGNVEEEDKKLHDELKNREPGIDNYMAIVDKFEHILIGGIAGSSWATPSLRLFFKDGTERNIPCYEGDSDRVCPDWFSLGCMSSEVQASMPNLEEEG